MFPTVMEYQVQINSIKAKLQETRARKKQQEELIMKVENQALKVSERRAGERASGRASERNHSEAKVLVPCGVSRRVTVKTMVALH